MRRRNNVTPVSTELMRAIDESAAYWKEQGGDPLDLVFYPLPPDVGQRWPILNEAQDKMGQRAAEARRLRDEAAADNERRLNDDLQTWLGTMPDDLRQHLNARLRVIIQKAVDDATGR